MTSNQISYWNLEETKRSNRANETETNRHNVVTEGETNRHNVAMEYETNRHNVQTELLTSQSNAENRRHNEATEMVANFNAQEAQRSHLANENIGRSQIDLGYSQVGLGYSQLAESSRHNQATETYNLLGLNETKNYNDETFQHWNRQDTNQFLSVGNDSSRSKSQVALNESQIHYNKIRPVTDAINAGANVIGTAIKGGQLLR